MRAEGVVVLISFSLQGTISMLMSQPKATHFESLCSMSVEISDLFIVSLLAVMAKPIDHQSSN